MILRTSGARCRLLIGPESRLEDGVILQLSQGASVEIGPRCHLRSGAVLNVSGRLQLLGDNQISFYSVVHCAESVLFEEMAGAAEGVTVVDSQHVHGDVGAPDEHYYHNNRTSPVVIGRNTWLAARSVITSGVTLGSRVTVAGNSLVAPGTYADAATLVGVPARMAKRRPPADRSN
ncbi:MAG: sugar acetyltransferase [Frankiales bacterium]|nr:sugar acetyltransferase [Frankiales bacterium]